MENILQKPVSEFMTTEVISAKKDTSIKEVIDLMAKNGILGLPVINDQHHVVGVITESDLLKHFTSLKTPEGVPLLGSMVELGASEFNDTLKAHCAETVEELMTPDAITICPTSTLSEAIDHMAKNSINRLPVTEGEGRLVGLLTRSDVVKQLAQLEIV